MRRRRRQTAEVVNYRSPLLSSPLVRANAAENTITKVLLLLFLLLGDRKEVVVMMLVLAARSLLSANFRS